MSLRLGSFGVEYVLVHPAEGLFHTALGKGQVHAQMAISKELPAVLDGHAHAIAGGEHIVHGFPVGPAPAGAVHEQHIGALGTAHRNPGEVIPDEAPEEEVFNYKESGEATTGFAELLKGLKL